MTGLNFIGFPTPVANPPSFQNYFAQDPAIANVAQYYYYPGGPFSILNPQQVFSPAITPVTRGQAYWVSATNVNNTYFGPFKLTLPSLSGFVFGTSAGQATVHLVNVTSNTITVSAQLLPSETPPAGQTNIVGAPPLLVEGALNSSNLTYAYSNLGTGVTNSWTLAPYGQPGCDVPVVIGVNRFAMTNATGSLYAGFLRFTDSLGYSDVDVPVSAVSANNAGLWVGSANISQVGSYLKTYATNLDGTYAFAVGTNYQYSVAPASGLVTSNYLVVSQVQTNTQITYFDTNQLTVNSYTAYGSLLSSNVFVLSTNLVVTEYVVTNQIIQTNIASFYFTNAGQLAFNTTNAYSTQAVVTAVSSNSVTVTNNIPLTPGYFRLSSLLSANSTMVQALVVDVNTDGYPDIVTANNGGNGLQNLSAFLNAHNGLFGTRTDYNAGAFTASAAVADVNGDGKPDIIGANNSDRTLSLLTNNGTGGFTNYRTISLTGSPTWVTATDVNADGWADLIVVESSTTVILTNNHSGGFIQSASLSGGGKIAVADVNGDGRPDLIAANIGGGNLWVYTNATKGLFALASSPAVSSPSIVVAVDVNGDSRIDLIASGTGNSVVVLTNSATGVFIPSCTNYIGSAGDSIASIAAGDLNADGRPDYVCADFSASAEVVMTNGGAACFFLASTIAVASPPVSVLVADLNKDGTNDIVSANNLNNSSPTISVLTNYAAVPSNGFPVAIPALTITNYNTISQLTQIGIQWGPVTNLVLTSNYATTNSLTVTNAEQFVVSTNYYTLTNYSTTSLSALTMVPTTVVTTNVVVATSQPFLMSGALFMVTNVSSAVTNIVVGSTNLVNGVTNVVLTVTNITLPVTNWISYNVSTNVTLATNYYQSYSVTNTLVVSNTYAILAGTTNLTGTLSNWLTNNSSNSVTVTVINNTNLALLIATNPAFVTLTNFTLATNTSYTVTGLNTNLGAVVTPFPLRLIIFNDGTNSTLMQRVYYGIRQDTNVVVATTESVLDVSHLSTARRISSTSLPWTAGNTLWSFSGQLALGGSLTTVVTDSYDDQPANPFLHTFHPDHNNLDLSQNPPHELPVGSQSFAITRLITLTIAPNTADFLTLTTANSTLSGYYQETTTLTGLGGATRTFTSAGSFKLKQISTIATLTTQ